MKVELLAPAKDVSIARSAILSGADAIYIGGSGFGARVGASNEMSDIENLVRFAHGYGAKVYMTMNTILFDDELEAANKQANHAWNIGVDAIIVQDMAYLEMGLKIELHASTQTFNFTPERVKFLEKAGFARVVLERALSLKEIETIRKQTNVELEAFIHGAICVGYSGQCYFSEAVTGRSGNRGACAQLCRSDYDLIDSKGSIIAKNDSVLSVGDMCMGECVKKLIEAGVCSLKIEGRLKNESYVVNNVAYYNKILNDLGVERLASGVSEARFEPTPNKSFLRRPTKFFFDNKRNIVGAPTRSLGELIGKVKRVAIGSFVVENGEKINNGDGICWTIDKKLLGTNVNKTEGNRVFANNLDGLKVGVEIYRNQDVKFNPSGKDVDRKIGAEIILANNTLNAQDVDGNSVTAVLPKTDKAQNIQKAIENLKAGFSKSGDTIFKINNVTIAEKDLFFMPQSEINRLRRELLDLLLEERLRNYVRRSNTTIAEKPTTIGILKTNVTYLDNVSNELAKSFYRRFGVIDFEQCLEVSNDFKEKELLRSRYCVRRERGLCPKTQKDNNLTNAQSMFIENNGRRFELKFDCERCEMVIISTT